MIKKTIKYVDFDNVERVEDFYFHLSRPEVLEFDAEYDGGLEGLYKDIIRTENKKELIALFKKLILASYGEKTHDGRHFMKEDDNGRSLARRFAQTNAYAELFEELASNSDAAAEFCNGIVPQVEPTDQDKPTLPPPAPLSVKDAQ